MRQEHGLIGMGVFTTCGGLALLLVRDLDGAGLYVAGMGLLLVAAGAWFQCRGGNAPHPVSPLPNLPAPAAAAGGCPKCSDPRSRAMTGAETTAYYKYDRFVLVRPRVCLTCGFGYEVQPSRWGCYLMLTCAAVGAVVGLAFLAGGPYALWLSLRNNGLDPVTRVKHVAGSIVLFAGGLCWEYRSWRVGLHYWRLLSRA